MLDIKFIRDHQEDIRKAIIDKNINLDLDRLLELDDKRRRIMADMESLKAQKNDLNDKMKMASKEEQAELIERGKMVKDELAKREPEYNEVKKEYDALMVRVPMIPSVDTPVGKDENDNKEVFRWGELPNFDFKPKDHIQLAQELDIVDFEKGAKVAGYRGYYLKNEGALLVMALMMYALHKMTKKGYHPFIPPTLIKGFCLFGSGYFAGTEYNSSLDNIYQVATNDREVDGKINRDKKFLVGTAEPSLLAYFSDEVLDEKNLPIKICGFSPCYRSEIGSYGKDTKGLYRVHEFMKVEQVVVSRADIEVATELQEEMVSISEEIHQDLGLPYRKLQICTGDMSAGKYRAFDLEAWMPGMNRWGETGSASNFLDWQARRLNIKYRDREGKKKYAYLLNNTALPSVRPLIAILENYQQKDGSVAIPGVLQSYMPDKMDKIEKKG